MATKAMKSAFGAAIAVVIAASVSFAKSYSVVIIYRAKVGNSAQLNPGTYHIQLLENATPPKLAFFNQNGKQVAEVTVKLKTEANKNSTTEVDYTKIAQNDHVITAIRLNGQDQELVLPDSGRRIASGS